MARGDIRLLVSTTGLDIPQPSAERLVWVMAALYTGNVSQWLALSGQWPDVGGRGSNRESPRLAGLSFPSTRILITSSGSRGQVKVDLGSGRDGVVAVSVMSPKERRDGRSTAVATGHDDRVLYTGLLAIKFASRGGWHRICGVIRQSHRIGVPSEGDKRDSRGNMPGKVVLVLVKIVYQDVTRQKQPLLRSQRHGLGRGGPDSESRHLDLGT